MKTVGIMQPYLFPYLGYFQLIRECDLFVWLDDVQYIKQGWINRNRILLDGHAQEFAFSVSKAAHTLPINERWYSSNFPFESGKFFKTLHWAYRTARMYEPVCELLYRLLSAEERNVAKFNCESLEALCAYMGIGTVFTRSSRLSGISGLRGEDRVIEIVKAAGADRYVNSIGGTSLYSYDRFAREGLTLKFLKGGEPRYAQAGMGFVPNLSIVDLLMHVDPASMSGLLTDYRLLGEGDDYSHVA